MTDQELCDALIDYASANYEEARLWSLLWAAANRIAQLSTEELCLTQT